MQERIKWTDEEIEKLVLRTAELRLQYNIPSMLELIKRAQDEALPADRRRKIPAITTISEITRAVTSKITELRKVEQVEIPVILDLPPPEPELTQALLDRFPTPMLASTLITRLTQGVAEIQEVMLKGAAAVLEGGPKQALLGAHNLVPSSPPPLSVPEVKAPEAPQKKVTIGVVGLLADQQRSLMNRVDGQPVTLVFMNTNRRPDIPPKVEYVICSRHISEGWRTTALDKHRGRVFFKQGLSSIMEAVREILAKEGLAKPAEA